MKAMIFAAGLGTRLRPLTDTRPKALVEINGVALLEIVARRLIAAGTTGLIINVHHFAEQIAGFVQQRSNFGIRVSLSYEERLLDTGGGLKKAADFFDDGQPFFVHNVDVISALDLQALYRQHSDGHALATLAVQARKTSRYLIFDRDQRLCGWKSAREQRVEWARAPAGETVDLAFNGIHVISPRLLGLMTEDGTFSIIKTYLRLVGNGEKIQAFRKDDDYWRDAGKIEHLEQIAREHANAMQLLAG
ncbi:MAG: nucleotidyltransferase family protein [bacterium]